MVEEILVGLPSEAREAGWRLLDAMDENSLNITAAFWAWNEDARKWELVLSSPRIPCEGMRPLLHQVREALNRLDNDEKKQSEKGFFLTLDDVSLQSPATLQVKDAKLRYGSVPASRRFTRRTSLGFDEAYVYRLQ